MLLRVMTANPLVTKVYIPLNLTPLVHISMWYYTQYKHQSPNLGAFFQKCANFRVPSIIITIGFFEKSFQAFRIGLERERNRGISFFSKGVFSKGDRSLEFFLLLGVMSILTPHPTIPHSALTPVPYPLFPIPLFFVTKSRDFGCLHGDFEWTCCDFGWTCCDFG